jgi:Zn-dependent protease
VRFSTTELRDLGIAWITLGVAFTVLLARPQLEAALRGAVTELGAVGETFLLSMVTVGVGFLLHELAHKVVAIRFGQVAEFRADFTMLGLALLGIIIGILFTAPGAVVHRGRISNREHGLIAVAGPVTNIALALLFVVPALVLTGFPGRVARFGLLINALLAGFNMIPFGPLDGRTVLDWHRGVYAVVAVPSILGGAFVLFGF